MLASEGGGRSNTVTSAVRLTFTVFSLTSGGCFSFLLVLSFFPLAVVVCSELVSLVVLVVFTVSSEPASSDSEYARNKIMRLLSSKQLSAFYQSTNLTRN